eukprot:CAMPEP_0202713292 /NCGR_PEP_ID=MMETSP1385-20130828/52480_1 /ASSEMBLY_ACC=CAM_ASM_000861 /TAXON_ID=933848 /ORGANISM="Elphidium margaritaceum" /LENGTH=306 /DNA_ID=CAMNT_0049373589 /DNA_START=35 /DNA_END=952 /DNA_ORIENTATION=-
MRWKYELFRTFGLFLVLCVFQPTKWQMDYFAILWIAIMSINTTSMFMIFHDCGHGSFVPESEVLNERIGRLLSIVVLTSFDLWVKGHNKHHSIQGNLNKFDAGATINFTVSQIKSFESRWLKLMYCIWRFPPFFFASLPAIIWFLIYPLLAFRKKEFLHLLGWIATPLCFQLFHQFKQPFYVYVAVYGLTSYFGAFFGVLLFHVQHGHNPPYRKKRDQGFNATDAAIYGSSYHAMPFPLSCFTMGIEYHHLHHFDTKLSGYALADYQANIERGNFDYTLLANGREMTRQFDVRLASVERLDFYDMW